MDHSGLSLRMLGSRLFNILAHLFAWVLFAALIWGFVSGNRSTSHPFFETHLLLFTAIYAICFYLNTYALLPQLYLRGRVALYILISIFLLFLMVYFKPFEQLIMQHGRFAGPPMEGHMPGPPPGMPHHEGPRGGRLDIVSIVLFLMVWSLGTSWRIFERYRASVSRAEQAETLRLQAELLALRSQVNPHFLFNTLNNLYSMSVTGHEKTSDGILKLSELMRYLTDEAGNESVPLQDELDCIANYIELQKIRLDERINLRYEVRGNTQGKYIAPLILLNFVENVFKHGISRRGAPLLLIQIRVLEDEIHFHSSNPDHRETELQSREGRGLANARRRLELIYPGQYSLQIHRESDTFIMDLKLRS